MTENGTLSEAKTIEESEELAMFKDFDLLPEIEAAILRMGFKTPTPVQVQTFKSAMAGKNLVAKAQTGTGKTAAFGIPMVQRANPKSHAIQGLVLAPTRELALQVSKELSSIGKECGVKCVPVYGGASFTKQVADIKLGAQIVVGTPGRVLDHIRRQTIRFDQLEMLVLDEADEMLSMGFEKEISEIIESLPEKRQTLLFSATVPDDIRRLTKRYMGDPEIISVSGDDTAAKDVTHYVYLVSGQMRQQTLVKVIEAERPDSALIFCNTREETQSLAQYLKKEGYNADWLNSDLTQSERERVMRATRKGELQFLVATDVAARGIDVSLLSHVINYSFPESLEIYVHRTGRTGRAGRQGIAVSLISPQDLGNLYMLRLTYKISPVEKTLVDDLAAARAFELKRMERLRVQFRATSDDPLCALARRVIQDARAEAIIAGLLKNHFDWIPATQSMAPGSVSCEEPDMTPLSESEVLKPATVTAEPLPEVSSRESELPTRRLKRERDSESDEEAYEEGTCGGDANEIYINAGRRDGLRISELMKQVMQKTNLPRTALGKVRMLTRSTFISITPEYFDAVLKALQSIEIDGAQLKAEPARQR